MVKKHVVILGLDGVPLKAFDRLFELGLLPFTKHIWPKLWTSELRVRLPYTLSSWTSISTGVNPGKHGIFDFLKLNPDGSFSITTRNMLERPTINEILSTENLSSIIINVPMTYPPFIRKNNMIVVSDWTIPELKTWPREEEETVKKFFTHERIKRYYSLEEYFEAISNGLEERISLIEYYFTKHRWDLFYTVISETDWVFHKVFGELIEDGEVNRKVAKIFYLVDKAIKMIYQNLPENTLLILCSDHGFMVARESLNANVLLEKMGLLKINTNTLNFKSRILLNLAKIMPSKLVHKLKYTAQVVFKAMDIRGFDHATNPIDYVNSKAFMTISYNLYINPLLPEREREQLREQLIKTLLKYNYMFQWLGYGQDYFWGPYTSRAPDIVLIPREGYNVTTRVFYRNIVEKGKWYVHSTTGFIAMNLEMLNAELGKKDNPLNYDITPTALAHLSLPLDPDMDGKPLIKVDENKIRYKKYVGLYQVAKKSKSIKHFKPLTSSSI